MTLRLLMSTLLLDKPNNEFWVSLGWVKGDYLHVALRRAIARGQTVGNARHCNDGIRAHAVLLGRTWLWVCPKIASQAVGLVGRLWLIMVDL